MKSILSILSILLASGWAGLSGQYNITTVMDPLIGSTPITAITINDFDETILVAGKKIFTYTHEVIDVFNCIICPDIRDIAIVGDAMYLANTTGIVKRTGKNMEYVDTFSVSRLIADGEGKLYGIVPQNGMVYWDGASWTYLSMGNSSLPTNQIYDLAIAAEGGFLWLVSNQGLISWNGSMFSVKQGPSGLSVAMNDVEIDDSGVVWVAAAFGGVAKYENGNWTTFPETFEPSQAVESLTIMNGEEIWTSTGGEGLYKYAGGTWEFISKEDLNEAGWQFNFVLQADAQNRLWIQNDLTPLKYLTSEMTGTDIYLFSDNGLIISPNPGSDRILIEGPDTGMKLDAIKVYSLDGRIVDRIHPGPSHRAEVNISGWLPGMYYVIAEGSDGKRYAGKFIRK